MAKKKKVSESDVSAWVGNYGYAEKRDDFMLEVITEIANGKYDPKMLRDEIIDYNG